MGFRVISLFFSNFSFIVAPPLSDLLPNFPSPQLLALLHISSTSTEDSTPPSFSADSCFPYHICGITSWINLSLLYVCVELLSFLTGPFNSAFGIFLFLPNPDSYLIIFPLIQSYIPRSPQSHHFYILGLILMEPPWSWSLHSRGCSVHQEGILCGNDPNLANHSYLAPNELSSGQLVLCNTLEKL